MCRIQSVDVKGSTKLTKMCSFRGSSFSADATGNKKVKEPSVSCDVV